MRFADKVVFITGAGAGIGVAAARKFGEEGAIVACNSVTDSAAKVIDELKRQGIESLFVQGDISLEADAVRMVQEVVDAYGRIDVLVNNAGIVLGGTIDDTKLEDFRRTLDVNVIGTFLMSQEAVKVMKRQGGGVIVNTASVAGIKGLKNRLAYASSKAAVIAMTKCLATELSGDHIRVNCVSPGTTMTPSLQERIHSSDDPEEAKRQFFARQPIGRLGEPEEIAEALLFAASDAAAFMTGSNIVIDGGMTM
ncbi:MAG: glucose 1-dehydrogenase [Clostridiales bacterium]|nr:glucose 1-dehydrogenase [Clostridiales bacterium]